MGIINFPVANIPLACFVLFDQGNGEGEPFLPVGHPQIRPGVEPSRTHVRPTERQAHLVILLRSGSLGLLSLTVLMMIC